MKNKKINKGKMSRQLVYFCLVVLTIVLIWAMVVKTIGYQMGVDVSDVLTFTSTVFGGELLLLLAKRIFAKPREEDSNDEGGFN